MTRPCFSVEAPLESLVLTVLFAFTFILWVARPCLLAPFAMSFLSFSFSGGFTKSPLEVLLQRPLEGLLVHVLPG